MHTLNFKKIQNEFVMLTLFHGQKLCDYLEEMEISDEIKNSFKQLVNDFIKDLFEMTEFDPEQEIKMTS